MPEATEKSPCVMGLVAHVDAGKTTLSEALLYTCGVRRQMGRVDHRDSFLDTHQLERQRGITIFSKTALLQTAHLDMTMVDTPGHVDFGAEMERTLGILDCAVLVINGSDGVQAHTLTLWDLLERYEIPTFLFVNKMDLPGVDKQQLLDQLRRRLSDRIVDFSGDSDQIAESAAMCDEELLEHYLRTGSVSAGQLRDLAARRKLFPCRFGSALKLEGVEELTGMLDQFAPVKTYPGEFSARVYKISRDPQSNRLTWLKITGGSLRVRESVTYMDRQGRPMTEKCVQLRSYSGDQFRQMELAAAGNCCAVQGLTGTYAGQVLGIQDHSYAPALEPVMTYHVVLPPDRDPLTVLPMLRQLEEEDPQLHILWDERLKQIRVRLMGKVQLEILRALVEERFALAVDFDMGRVAYKETIRSTVEGVGHFEPLRHYAEVHLLLEPGEPGSGIQAESKCSLEILDINYQNLILTHILEKTHRGVLTGSPVTDVKITLMSGRAHLKHTEGGDFREATYRAIRQGLMQAKSVLLEPWYSFTLTVPTPQIGRAITDVRNMSGEFSAPETAGEYSVLRGSLPVSEVGDYAAEVASYTRGTGVFQTRMLGYRPCHDGQEVIDRMGYDPESDLENTPDSVFCAHGAGFRVKWDQVPEYMHLSSVLQKPEQPQIVTQNLRLDDRELERIMEREFGPVRRRQYTPPANRSAADRYPIAPPKEQLLIVDGYNVLFADEELEQMSRIDLGSARQRLTERLQNYASYRNCRIVLVFDGYRAKGNPGQKEDGTPVQIVYTREGQTADAYIESLAVQIGSNYNVRVVTSDALVQLSSFRSGLLRLSAREFWQELERTQGYMRAELETIRQKENRKFHQKEVQE